MAFSFGPTTGSTTGFGSGFGSTPAPATSSSFGFGAAASGSLSTPGPASSGFGFGNPSISNAPQGTFSTPAAPAFGAPGPSGFGAPNASTTPAPSAFGFGGAPTANTSFSFSNPSPSLGFGGALGGATTSLGQQQQQQYPPQVTISASTQYNDLSPQMKQAFDTIHDAIMRHKRSMVNLSSMSPQLLIRADSDGSVPINNRKQGTPLIHDKLKLLLHQIDILQKDVELLQSTTMQQKEASENVMVQATLYAKWPIETMAHRKGVRLTATANSAADEEKKDDGGVSDVQMKLRETLDRTLSVVDRLEKMPSPYLWEVIHTLERRIAQLEEQGKSLSRQLNRSSQFEFDVHSKNDPMPRFSLIAESQHQTLWQLSSSLDRLRSDVERVRFRYRHYDRGENVLDKATDEELFRQRKLHEEIQLQFMKAPSAETLQSTDPAVASTPVTTARAPFSLGSMPAAPPSTSFSFAGSNIGATPTPSTSAGTGFSFAGGLSNPSPAASFGQTPQTAAFGSTTTGTPSSGNDFNASGSSKKKQSRGSGRLRR